MMFSRIIIAITSNALAVTPNVIKVVLVDDHRMLRKGLRLLLEREPDLRVVGEAGNAQCAIEQVKTSMPDVVLMDLNLPDENGLVAARKILAETPSIKIIILSSDPAPALLEEILKIGVQGYILKENALEETIVAIRKVMAGRLYFYPEATPVSLRNREKKAP